MRLLDADKLEVVDVADDSVPEYAILSHTWGPKEVSFQHLERLTVDLLGISERQRLMSQPVFVKVVQAAKLAVQNGYRYVWIDTCCIDKTSSAELSEAINSMYRWYEQAALCFVYLADVAANTDNEGSSSNDITLENSSFRKSRWFTRGWTLQELIAPRDVRFYASDWSYIAGHKENIGFRNLLSEITGIDDQVLKGSLSLQDLSVSARMKWAALRKTTRTEDNAYCLMGIFGVNMPLLYGEGRRAFIRLQEEILKETDDQSLFAWTSQRTDGQIVDRLSGLLAESPFDFKNVGNVRPLPPILTRDSVPSNITNQGLRIQLYLTPVGDEGNASVEEEYHAILDCSLKAGYREYCPTIHLRRLWGDQFARVRSYECALLPPPADDISTSHKGYQTVYVKQKPVYTIPEFTLPIEDVRMPHTVNEREIYHLEAVYPPDRWHSDSLSLKSVFSQLDRAMGLFRFKHPFNPHLKVDVAVGLRRVSQKGWESWCSQLRYRGDSLESVFHSYDQWLREIKDLKLAGPPIGYHPSLELDDSVGSQAQVIETRTHGRSYNTLYVFSKAQIYTSLELHSIPSRFVLSGMADTGVNLNDEVRTLTMPCSVADGVDLSIFPTSELTRRVRTNAQGSAGTKTCIQLFKELLASTDSSQLQLNAGKSSRSGLTLKLLRACKDGEITQVMRLIRTEASIEGETENFHSFRPIHWAAVGGHLHIIRLLLGAGAELYPRTSQKMTPVHIAAIMGHLDTIKYFFEKAAVTSVGIDALLDMKTLRTLDTPYHLAAAYVFAKAPEPFLEVLFTFGQDRKRTLCSTNYLDETPLHRAAAMNNTKIVEYILRQESISVQGLLAAVDKFGRTPIWHAACAGSFNSVVKLGSHGADLNLADDFGRSPLHAACLEGKTIAVHSLLELGANPNCETSPLSLRPCHYAALFGRIDCLRSLIQHRADLDAGTTESTYFRPIHLAAANGWHQCVKEICAAGSDPDIPSTHYIVLDASGSGAALIAHQTQSAEEIALRQGHLEIVQFFKSRKIRQDQQPINTSMVVQNMSWNQNQGLMDLGTLQGDPTSLNMQGLS